MSNSKYNPILISNIPDKLTKPLNSNNPYINPDFYNGKYEYKVDSTLGIFFQKSDCAVSCSLSYTNDGEFIALRSGYYGCISIYLCTEEYDDSDKYGAVSYTDGDGFLIFFKNKNTGKYLFIDPTTVDDDYLKDMYDPDKHELFSFQNLNKTPINLNNYDLEIWTENYKIDGNSGNVTNSFSNANKLLRFLDNRRVLAHYVTYKRYDPTQITSFIVVDSSKQYSGKYVAQSEGSKFNENNFGDYMALAGGMFVKADDPNVRIYITGGNHLFISDNQSAGITFSGPEDKITKDNFWNNKFTATDDPDDPNRTITILPDLNTK